MCKGRAFFQGKSFDSILLFELILDITGECYKDWILVYSPLLGRPRLDAVIFLYSDEDYESINEKEEVCILEFYENNLMWTWDDSLFLTTIQFSLLFLRIIVDQRIECW